MRILNLFRPEYCFRPRQLWRRLHRDEIFERNRVMLAWELPIELDDRRAYVGQDILNLGLYDRIVPETLARLLDPGETAFDIGANIGQNASIMALVSGLDGHVFAFEPAPESLRVLTQNVSAWSPFQISPITIVPKGVSSTGGVGKLRESDNPGGFSLDEDAPSPMKDSWIEIQLTTLDAFVPEDLQIGVMKIDVEGHERSVLLGAERVLRQKQVRDIVYEDFQRYPSPVASLLQSGGYTLFSLHAGWRTPFIIPIEEYSNQNREHDPPNFLATSDPERARARFRSSGLNLFHLRARLRSVPHDDRNSSTI